MDWKHLPIVICVRDRLSDLVAQTERLTAMGYDNLLLLDNHSTYPPLVEWLETCPFKVQRLKSNIGSRAPWVADVPERAEWWVYTDPDVVPLKECPDDFVEHLYFILQAHNRYAKAGLGLYWADVTGKFRHRALEASFKAWERWVGDAYVAPIETTLALYRPGAPFTFDALRSPYPYEARHLPWYRAASPTEEDVYYLQRAKVARFDQQGNREGGSDWAGWYADREPQPARGLPHTHQHGDHAHHHDHLHDPLTPHDHGFPEPCGGVDDF